MESIPPDKMAKMLVRKEEQDAIAAANVAYHKQLQAQGFSLSEANRRVKERNQPRKERRRFWEKVDVDVHAPDPDKCWPWKGNLQGRAVLDGRFRRCTRISWELEHGPVPEGKCVRPTCGTRLCCNPAHLALATPGPPKKKKGPPPYRPREET